MKVPDIIIAVDGYSSTGKSTFAKLLASTFGLLYLDSGALYRAVTLFAQRSSLISADNVVSDALEAALSSVEAGFDSLGRTCLGEECVETQIRSMEVSSQVSPIAAVPFVREYVDERLHLLASKGGVVMDGRDIGTTVFPNAQLKIFMTASDEVRARRRYDEMLAKGQSTTLEEVKKNLQQRDYIDSHRETSPLKRAEGSFLLDNSDMSMEEELQWARGLIQGLFRIYE